MTQGQPISNESVQSASEVLREQPLLPTPIDRILQKLSCMELPAKEHFEQERPGGKFFNCYIFQETL